MKTHNTCQRKHQMLYEFGLRPVQKSQSLTVGSAVHAAIDKHIKGRGEDFDIIAFMQEAITHNGEYRDYDRAAASVLFSTWKAARGMDAARRALRSEWTFRYSLPGTKGVVIAGQIDRVQTADDGNIQVVDMKTTSRMPDDHYWTLAELDHQEAIYLWAVRKSGFKTAHQAVREVIVKPDIEPSMVTQTDEQGVPIVLVDATGERAKNKDGSWKKVAAEGCTTQKRRETVDEFATRLAGIVKPETHIIARTMYRTDEDIDRAIRTVKAAADQIRGNRKANFYPQNTAACKMWNRPCEFAGICTTAQAGTMYDGFTLVAERHQELKGNE
jgi:RecB family exonuclease